MLNTAGASWKSVCVAGNALAFGACNVMFHSWCVFGALCGLTPVHHGCWHRAVGDPAMWLVSTNQRGLL